MPIIIKEYEWNQTKNNITINVPLRGVHQSKVDIFYSQRYIKANYEQFFFEVLLLHAVDVSKSNCILTDKDMVFELVKTDSEIWTSLEPNISKKEKLELKLECIRREYEVIEAKEKDKESRKAELKRLAVSEQMKIDTQIRENIERIKKEEKDIALGDLENWQNNLSLTDKKILKKKKRKFDKYLAKNSSDFAISDIHLHNSDFKIPSPRLTQELEIEFTPRHFPTPMRESKTEEENEWLKKQAEARRSVGFISEDLRPEEKSPQFLLKKGDEFMRNQNFLGAISAYTFGIHLSNQFVDLYIARSRAHYAQGNYQKTAVDCSTALELMVPKLEANLKERADCIGRRGMALCKLNMLSKGINEIEASLELVPNEEYKQFLLEAEKEWMNNSDSD
ncbi:hypothetical protein WA026_016392 [Henosepilachna vigintioctopunctata]|uniref:Dynein axonemal assembly factor 4 n=1 Tax=Henosepilachna vigintioctopunctata TaxID=420089 RepID=A0AAW1UM23_9CUCU